MKPRKLSLQPLLIALGIVLVLTVTGLQFARQALKVASAPTAPAAAPPEVSLVQHEALAFPLASGESARVERFRFALADTAIEVVDLGYETPLADVLDGAELVVNGGFGARDGERRYIEGLLIADGRELAPLDSRLGGGVLSVREGRAQVDALEAYRPSPRPEFALQCRPRLVEAGRAVPGLHDGERAARTAICVRDGGATLDVLVTLPSGPGPTLGELGEFLASQGCEQALNLDGGPSTAVAYARSRQQVRRLGAGLSLPYALRFRRREAGDGAQKSNLP